MRVDAGAQADAGADRRQGDAAGALIIHAQPGHEIETAFHAGEALIEPAVLAQIVDQGEAFGGVAADVETDRGASPIDLLRLAALADQPARAIAEADYEGAAAFIATSASGWRQTSTPIADADITIQPAMPSQAKGT